MVVIEGHLLLKTAHPFKVTVTVHRHLVRKARKVLGEWGGRRVKGHRMWGIAEVELCRIYGIAWTKNHVTHIIIHAKSTVHGCGSKAATEIKTEALSFQLGKSVDDSMLAGCRRHAPKFVSPWSGKFGHAMVQAMIQTNGSIAGS